MDHLMQTSTPLTDEQYAEWKALAIKCFPEEACAYIVDDKIFPVKNISPEPTKKFAVSVMDRFEASKGKITGFLHSHPYTPKEAGRHDWPINWPTTADMKSWMADDTRWGISGCDGEECSPPIWLDEDYIAPLEGRHYIHGIWDCYSAVRDWFRVEKGIIIPNYPREMNWWEKGEDLYSANFEKEGFVQIRSDEVGPGDVGMSSTGSNGIINHTMVIVDDARIFQQCVSRNGQRLSGYADRGRWSRNVVKYIRYSPST